jgi:regulator of protease activity HflC (stomatin/prohibitin superfamily)
MRFDQDTKDAERAMLLAWIKIACAIIVAVFAISIGSCSFDHVEPGNRGIKVTWGKPAEHTEPPGLVFLIPFAQKLHQLSISTFTFTGTSAAYTADTQQAKISFTVNYQLDPTKVNYIFNEVGRTDLEWRTKLIGGVVPDMVERVLGQYDAASVSGKREEVANRIRAAVANALQSRNIILTGFALNNIDYTDQFETAIENKVIAQQEAIREQNNTVKIKEKATQQIETARGNAEATVLNAEADAKSISIRAKALEQNAKLVEWEAVQKWDGKLPYYMMGGNATPFINIK